MMLCVLASPALLVGPARPAAVSTGRLTPPVAKARAGARKEARSRKRSGVKSWYDSGTQLIVDNPTPAAAKPVASVASQGGGGLAGWWDSIVSRSPSFGGKNRMCTNIEVPADDPVISWYDAGTRLAVEAPAPAPAPAPPPAPPPAPARTPAPVPVAPVVSWFDTGIRLSAEEPAPAPEAEEEEEEEEDIWISGGF